MKKLPLLSFLIIIVMGFSAWYPSAAITAAPVTYYISGDGNDQNNGTSTSSPWKSFANVEKLQLKAGDRVLLRRGDIWHERLTLHASGSSSAWVYIGPYGSLTKPAPTIELNQDRNDICIVAQDLIFNGTTPVNNGLNYLQIDNINMKNSRIGVYFRYLVSNQNVGIKVTNCTFTNMVCDQVMKSLENSANVSAELSMAKGSLDTISGSYYSASGGGGGEYVWPSAITIGGRTAAVSGNSADSANKVSNITIENCKMENCIDGLNALFYNCQQSLANGGANKGLFKNINMRNCTLTGSVNGLFAFDGVDGGWNGTSSSEWGNFDNLHMLSGSSEYSFVYGMTGAIINNAKNLRVNNCEFSNQTNNGKPDGCGFDLESNTENIEIENSIFANNEGEGILMMDGGSYGYIHRNVTISNNLFYNNLQSITDSNTNNDIFIINTGNENIHLLNNHFVSKVKTAGIYAGTIGIYGPQSSGVTATGNQEVRNDNLPSLQDQIQLFGFTAAQKEVSIQQKSAAEDYQISTTTVASETTKMVTEKTQTGTENNSEGASKGSTVTTSKISHRATVNTGETDRYTVLFIVLVAISVATGVLLFKKAKRC